MCGRVLAGDAANRKALYRRGALRWRGMLAWGIGRSRLVRRALAEQCPEVARVGPGRRCLSMALAEQPLPAPPPRPAPPHRERCAGQALCALGRYEGAVDDLRQAVRLSPESEKARAGRGWLEQRDEPGWRHLHAICCLHSAAVAACSPSAGHLPTPLIPPQDIIREKLAEAKQGLRQAEQGALALRCPALRPGPGQRVLRGQAAGFSACWRCLVAALALTYPALLYARPCCSHQGCASRR